MAAFPISVQNPSPVFGLPANLCKKFCPQYGHRIIFSRKCYYGPQCSVPFIISRLFHHGEKAENKDRAQQMGSTFGCDTPTTPRRSLLGVPFLHRLSSTISKRIAYNDPTKQRTNFGWMKKDEVPYHLRHDRGSQ
jgi:hypothetical protein